MPTLTLVPPHTLPACSRHRDQADVCLFPFFFTTCLLGCPGTRFPLGLPAFMPCPPLFSLGSCLPVHATHYLLPPTACLYAILPWC